MTQKTENGAKEVRCAYIIATKVISFPPTDKSLNSSNLVHKRCNNLSADNYIKKWTKVRFTGLSVVKSSHTKKRFM